MSLFGKWVKTPMWDRALVIEERDGCCLIDICAGIGAPRCHWEAASHLRLI